MRPGWPRRVRSRGWRLTGRGAAVAPPDGSPAEQPAREPGTKAVPPAYLDTHGAWRNAGQFELEAAASDTPPAATRAVRQHDDRRAAKRQPGDHRDHPHPAPPRQDS